MTDSEKRFENKKYQAQLWKYRKLYSVIRNPARLFGNVAQGF